MYAFDSSTLIQISRQPEKKKRMYVKTITGLICRAENRDHI